MARSQSQRKPLGTSPGMPRWDRPPALVRPWHKEIATSSETAIADLPRSLVMPNFVSVNNRLCASCGAITVRCRDRSTALSTCRGPRQHATWVVRGSIGVEGWGSGADKSALAHGQGGPGAAPLAWLAPGYVPRRLPRKRGATALSSSTAANPGLAFGVPNGSRTRVTAVKGRCPRPLDDRDEQAG